jgi:hypothetical protein
LTAPYTPPASFKPQAADNPLYPQREQKLAPPAAPAVEAVVHEEKQNPFWSILLLSLGTNLFVLGLLQFFFSDQGVLRLEWNSAHWFFYCLGAIPLLFFGWKKNQ